MNELIPTTWGPLTVIPDVFDLTYKPQKAFPLSNELAQEVKYATDQTGSSQSLFMDEMIINDEFNGIKKMHMILAQVESIDQALKQNYFRRRTAGWKFRWFKRLAKIIPIEPFKLKVEQWEHEFEDTKKHYAKALIRKEGFLNHYAYLKKTYGCLDLKSLELEEPRSQIMRLFGQSISSTMARGQPSEGQYLYANQTGLISESELYFELKMFCFDLDDSANIIRVRPSSLDEKKKFIEAMGNKYGIRTRSKSFLAFEEPQWRL